MKKVGIEKIGAYGGSLSLSMDALAGARGGDAAQLRDVMMVDERGLIAEWEDPVTMAVAAAKSVMLPEDLDKVGLLMVASESGVDQEKPMSTWVQRYLGLRSDVRNFEVKHACYGATGALHVAAGWLASGVMRGRTALIVNTDVSRMHLGKPWEYVMGAAAVAVLVSERPDMLEIELGASGIYTNEVSDLTRPTADVETGNSETSLLSYLDGLENAFDGYLARRPGARDYDGYFARNIYHLPFGGMGYRAHKTLLRRVGILRREDVHAHFAKKTAASLRYARRIGGTYGSSTFLAMLALFAGDADLRAGERIGVFSYGSGSCAEFWSGLVGPRARERARAAGLDAALDRRRGLTVEEYERIETLRTGRVSLGDYTTDRKSLDGFFESQWAGGGHLVFDGMQEYYRRYAWS